MKPTFETIDKEIVDHFFKAMDDPTTLQLFVTAVYPDEEFSMTKHRHKQEILGALLLGEQDYGSHLDLKTEKPLYFMSGFIEQKHRDPTVNDKILIIRGEKYFSSPGMWSR